MGWCIALHGEDGERVRVRPFRGGSTAADHRLAEVDVTFNHYERFEAAGVLPASLHGRRAADVEPLLAAAAAVLGTERDPDPWARTPGNAGWICALLASWAQEHPEATFVVV